MGPIVEKLAAEFKGKVDVRVYNVGTDQAASALFGQMGGTGVPEFFLIKSDGTIDEHIIGGIAEGDLRALMDAAK